jgi:predicted unusual protein kinase regulating ubiquinone biosynthesis (AarF/ABC1/UbiB family)
MKFLLLFTSVALFLNGPAAYSKNEWEELTEAFKKTLTTLKSETSTQEDKREAAKRLFEKAKDLSTFKDTKKEDKEKISKALENVFRLYENNVFNLLSPDKEISDKAPKEIIGIAAKTAQQVSSFYYLMENLGTIIEDTKGKKNKNKPLEAKTEKKIEEVFEHLGKLGVFFGKTAQSVSNLDFVFGKYAERLRPYQDKFGEELEYEVISEIFKKNTGKTIEESYASFDKKPLVANQ